MTPSEFLERAISKHGDRYKYPDLPDRITDKTKIMVCCRVHGSWVQRAGSHIREGYGCRKCTMLERYGAEHPSKVASIREKRRGTFIERFGFDHPMKNESTAAKASLTWRQKSPEEISNIMRKKETTYGYQNPFAQNDIKTKIRHTRIARGQWTDDSQLTEFRVYKRTVWRLTETSYRNHKDKINPNGVPRSRSHHLDHILSITHGFRLGLAPETVAHHINLRILDGKKNRVKGNRSELTPDDLLKMIDDYSVRDRDRLS